MQVTKQDVKKEERLSMKSPVFRGEMCKGCFSNSMLILKARFSMSETETDTTFETS